MSIFEALEWDLTDTIGVVTDATQTIYSSAEQLEDLPLHKEFGILLEGLETHGQIFELGFYDDIQMFINSPQNPSSDEYLSAKNEFVRTYLVPLFYKIEIVFDHIDVILDRYLRYAKAMGKEVPKEVRSIFYEYVLNTYYRRYDQTSVEIVLTLYALCDQNRGFLAFSNLSKLYSSLYTKYLNEPIDTQLMLDHIFSTFQIVQFNEVYAQESMNLLKARSLNIANSKDLF